MYSDLPLHPTPKPPPPIPHPPLKVERERAAKLQQDSLVDWVDYLLLRFDADKCKVLHLVAIDALRFQCGKPVEYKQRAYI